MTEIVRPRRFARWSATLLVIAVAACWASCGVGAIIYRSHQWLVASFGGHLYFRVQPYTHDFGWSFIWLREFRGNGPYYSSDMLWQNPTRPEWTKDRLGQIIGAVVPHWLPLGVALMTAAFLWSRGRLRKPGSCPNCGYDLTGNESGRCSECGEDCTEEPRPSSTHNTLHGANAKKETVSG